MWVWPDTSKETELFWDQNKASYLAFITTVWLQAEQSNMLKYSHTCIHYPFVS